MSENRITLLGVGLMGLPMGRRLIEAGFAVTAWNRTRAKAEALTGAVVADTVAEALQTADTVITLLENGPVVDTVLYAADTWRHARPGTLFIDMSSIPPGMAKRHAAILREGGMAYLDAPVSGGVVGAQAGDLAIMAGGDVEHIERARPVFQALGRLTHIGPCGSGQIAKCANQAIVGITLGAVAEALLLAAAGGANPAAVREALMGGFAASRILELHGQRMIDRRFVPGGTARVQLKDLRTILDTGTEHGLTLPLTGEVTRLYEALIDAGLENVDHSGVLLALERINAPARLGTAEDKLTD